MIFDKGVDFLADQVQPAMRELVGLALACGAADVGGPLSRAERAVASKAVAPSSASLRKTRSAISAGEDPLGEMFCETRSSLDRRPLGAFYTRDTIVQPMIEWAFEQHPSRFVDPGCGSGRFTRAAALRDRRIGIVAIDIDPIATLLTRAALAVIGVKNARILQEDYLKVDLHLAEGRSAFVGNPPYVRHHGLTAGTKALAVRLAASIGTNVSGLAGLHALFYLATVAKHAKRGDVGSFVTSAEWLDVGYGSIIRAMFTNGMGGRSLTVFDPKSIPFDDAMTTAAITTFEIGGEPAKTHVRSVTAGRRIRLERGRTIERTALAESRRWTPLLTNSTHFEPAETIGSLFRVSRGQVTGNNGFFVLSREEAALRGIVKFCHPLITSAEEVLRADGIVRDSPGLFVGLEIPKGTEIEKYSDLAAYLREGLSRGVHKGYVARHRSPWYSVAFPRPPILATYMARQAPVFARNPDSLGLLNVTHGLYPRRPMTTTLLDSIVRDLNAARETYVGRGRTYHGGLEKFEPREMEHLPLRVAL